VPCAGLTEAGSIVVLLALGVAISNADWSERVGERERGQRGLYIDFTHAIHFAGGEP